MSNFKKLQENSLEISNFKSNSCLNPEKTNFLKDFQDEFNKNVININ